jgi:hypothetical protein
MQLPIPPKNAYAEIKPDAARAALSNNQIFDDDAALSLVVKDAARAEAFELSKAWVLYWNTANSLYQSPYSARYWEGTQVERANVPFFTVATAVNSLVPQILNGLFYQDPPFMVQNRPKTPADAARASGAIISYQLDDIDFKESLRQLVVNAVLFGTGIGKWGWEIFTKTRKVYKLKNAPSHIPSPIPGQPDTIIEDEENIIEETIEETVDRPVFDNIVNLRYVLVDPGLNVPDIRKAKYVIHRQYLTWEDLDKLRDRPGYDIPSREKLLELFLPPKEEVESAPSETQMQNPLWDARALPRYQSTTEDPFSQPLEVLERWDCKRCIVVLQKKLVICNDENPYGQIPYLSVNWWDVPEAFWGMGLAKTIGSEQRLQQGVTNAWLDGVSLNLNGVYVRVEGKSQAPSQSIRMSPGKIINVTEKDSFTPLDRLPAVPEAGQAIMLSQARAEQVSGAGEAATQGIAGASGHSNLARSATGANLIAGGTGARIQDFVEKLCYQVFLPFLYNVQELNAALLPTKTYKSILSDELEHTFMKTNGDILELRNARLIFAIGAGAKLQARRSMAQAIPIMLSYLQSPSVTEALALEGKKVDNNEIIKMIWEVSDWRNQTSIIIPMTPDDQKRWMAQQQMNKDQIQYQNKSKLLAQQQQGKANLVDQQNTFRAVHEIMRQDLEKSAGPESLTGQPGATGWGG